MIENSPIKGEYCMRVPMPNIPFGPGIDSKLFALVTSVVASLVIFDETISQNLRWHFVFVIAHDRSIILAFIGHTNHEYRIDCGINSSTLNNFDKSLFKLISKFVAKRIIICINIRCICCNCQNISAASAQHLCQTMRVYDSNSDQPKQWYDRRRYTSNKYYICISHI